MSVLRELIQGKSSSPDCQSIIIALFKRNYKPSKSEVSAACARHYNAAEVESCLIAMEEQGLIKVFVDTSAKPGTKGKRRILFQLISDLEKRDKPQTATSVQPRTINTPNTPHEMPEFLKKNKPEQVK